MPSATHNILYLPIPMSHNCSINIEVVCGVGGFRNYISSPRASTIHTARVRKQDVGLQPAARPTEGNLSDFPTGVMTTASSERASGNNQASYFFFVVSCDIPDNTAKLLSRFARNKLGRNKLNFANRRRKFVEQLLFLDYVRTYRGHFYRESPFES